MKVEQLIEDLESQLKRLKAMKLEGDVNVNFVVTDNDSYGGDVLAVSDIEILFLKWRDNSILVDVNYSRKSW
tara:strand:- start:96 stop:311 length:216 start_codon:yes stop_codon:yes gene_type:complete